MFLLYVRHGQPDYANDCLTDVGRIQAKAVSERLAILGLDKIYSSTQGRAIETAKHTADKLNLPIEGVDFARENLAHQDFAIERNGRRTWCFYDEETLKLFASEEVENRGFKWYEDPLFKETNFKSGVLRVENAVNGFLKELGYERNEKTGKISAKKHLYDRVALFAHGGFGMIFVSTLLHIPYPMFCTRFVHLGLSSVTAFKFPDEGEGFFPKTFQYSNDSHLYKENLLDTYDMRTF